MEIFNKMIASALNIAERQVNNTLSLLNGGATIPLHQPIPKGSNRRTG